LGLWCLSM